MSSKPSSRRPAKPSGGLQPGVASLASASTAADFEELQKRFVRNLLVRGEAVELKPGEVPPPGVTHRIVGWKPDGTPKVERLRFSPF